MESNVDEDFLKLQKLLRERDTCTSDVTAPPLEPPPAYDKINSETHQDVAPPYFYKPEDQTNIDVLPPEPNPGAADVLVPPSEKTVESVVDEKKTETDEDLDALSCILVSLFCLMWVAIAGLSIAKIAMGSSYLHDCDIRFMIPIYLIVSGLAPLYFTKLICGGDDSSDCSLWQICWSIVGFLFCLAWLICGSVWVYPTYSTVMAEDFRPCTATITENCSYGTCDTVIIKFAFAMVTLDWIFLVLMIVLFIWVVIRDKSDKN
ncbi:uncharacterized protein LOC132757148 [Ruditapes philippinarum]|uniref:uncharacterized protein LOC132757148 n=1 Tax=Ruditapes philippinarum TaxID=129788 RepID=UPI00295B17D9|nr:uncharacterized protein LOC132757148 [Ruditapes philippinarum]